jgi:hypothetical protein
LTNSVLTEDSIVFRREDPVASYEPLPSASEPEASVETTDLAADLRPRSGPVSDARLKGPALSEPEESEVVVPIPVTGSPRALARNPSIPPTPAPVPQPDEPIAYYLPRPRAESTVAMEREDAGGYDDVGPTTMRVEQEPEPVTLIDGSDLLRQATSGSDELSSGEVEAQVLEATSEVPYPEEGEGPTAHENAVRDGDDTADDQEVTNISLAAAAAGEPDTVLSKRPPGIVGLEDLPEDEEPAPSGGFGLGYLLMAVAALIAATGTVATFGVAWYLDVGGLRTAMSAPLPDLPTDVPTKDPTVVTPGDLVAPNTEPTDGIRFDSVAPGTTKVTVRCTGANAKGETSATVAVESAATCTVTAFFADRDRMSTVVNDAKKGVYQCFANGEAACRP